MRARAYEWFLGKVGGGGPFSCCLACGDTFHAKDPQGRDIFEPCTVYDIRLALECLLETLPEIGPWTISVDQVSEGIERITFASSTMQ
jgi:hypothetical protein